MTPVLIVDDKEENLYYLEALLKGKGYEPVVARHGAEALGKARQHPPSLIISDLLMPVMDGYTLLRHWKTDPELQHIPFIVYTATYTERSDEELALKLGADEFILKPAEPEDFLSRMARVQARGQARVLPLEPSLPDTPHILLAQYSQTLIRKLEEKTLQLEQANRALQRDITERKLVEATLRASEASMAAAQRIAHFGSWEMDLASGETPDDYVRTLRWSAEAYRIAGLEPYSVEASSELFYQLVPPEDHAPVREAMRRTLQDRRPYSVIHRMIRPNGEVRIIHETAELHCDEVTGQPVRMIGTAHDITEQRAAAEALERSEKEQRQLAKELALERSRLVAAQKLAKLGNWEADLTTLEINWLEETYRIFEKRPGQFHPTYDSFLELVHPEDRAMVDEAFCQSFFLPYPQECQHRIVMPDGRVKHLVARWQVFHDETGKALRAIGTTQDITEIRQAEAELQRTHHLLKAVADGLPEAVFVKDLKGRYLLFNEGAARLVGKQVEDVIGRDDTALFNPEDARVVMENDRQVVATGETRTKEEVLTAAGVTRTYLATKVPYRDREGNIIGTIGISTDITARKRDEEKLREQAALLDSARDAIIVRGLDHRIHYWNRGAERLYGWPAADAVGRSIKELLYKDPMPFILATAAAIESGEWVGEIEQFNRDGKALMIEGRWTLLRDGEGRPKSILAINTDVTDRKRLEQQILRAQRMDSIGTLAGGIAHDLNNVLSPILMSIELLRTQEKDERRREILATIESSAQRGAAMVRQVLSFGRGMESDQVEVPLRQILKDVEKMANETFLKTIEVRCAIPADLWTVTGDPTQLHQVLLNLCVNARDAMPDGGILSLGAENILVDENYASMNIGAKPGPHVVLKVEDNGNGMPPEVAERVFEPFFTTKAIGKGTGLGLSTTLAIIKSHGGFVRVESDVGVGTAFWVYLPARMDAAKTGVETKEPTLPMGKGELVLLVDDEAAVQSITRQTLEGFGYRVLLAADGAEAASLFADRKEEIDIVLTDMMMPVMDGPTTIKVLKRMKPDLKVIGASGLHLAGLVARAADAGVKHFIPKPYTTETLLTTLRQALDDKG